MGKMVVNQTQGMIIGIINKSTLIPSQIIDSVESLYPIWYTSRANVYAEIGKMVEQGLLKAGEPIVSMRHAVPYSVTEKGHRAYQVWKTEVEPRTCLQDPILLRCALDIMNEGKIDPEYRWKGSAAYVKERDKYERSTSSFKELLVNHFRALSSWLGDENNGSPGTTT